MNTYGFTVQVRHIDVENEAQMAALENLTFEATAGGTNGQDFVEVVIDDFDPLTAARRAQREIESCGVVIERFDFDLVPTAEIASRCNTHREAVRLWTTGKRRSGFPPAFTNAGGSALWLWSDVFEWLQRQSIEIDGLYSDLPLPADVLMRLNGRLASGRAVMRSWGTPVQQSVTSNWTPRRTASAATWTPTRKVS